MDTQTFFEIVGDIQVEDPLKSLLQGMILGKAIKETSSEPMSNSKRDLALYWFTKGAGYALTELIDYINKSKTK